MSTAIHDREVGNGSNYGRGADGAGAQMVMNLVRLSWTDPVVCDINKAQSNQT